MKKLLLLSFEVMIRMILELIKKPLGDDCDYGINK